MKIRKNNIFAYTKERVVEIAILCFFIIFLFVYYIPLYRSGFIYFQDIELLKALCLLDSLNALTDRKIEPVFLLLEDLFCRFTITQPAFFHYINTTLHVLNSILIFYFSRTLFFFFTNASHLKIASIICALLFCFHPINADTVFWIYSMKELSLTFFCLLSLISFLNFIKDPDRKIYYVLSLLFLVASCLTSRYSFQIFIIYIFLSIFLSTKETFKTNFFRILPFLVICIFAFCIYFINDFYGYSLISQVSSKNLSVYFTTTLISVKNLFYPIGISFYSSPIESFAQLTTLNIVLAGLGILSLLTALLIGYFNKNRLLLFSSGYLLILIILGHLFVESTNLININNLNYFVAFGFSLFVGAVYCWINKNGKKINFYISLGIIFVILCLFGLLTFKKMETWRNEVTLWDSVLEFYPKNLFAEEQKSQAIKYHRNLILDKYGDEKPNVRFLNDEVDLGKVTINKTLDIEFEFENLGDKPVIISNVLASCGCTTTKWTNIPILPTKKGRISAKINVENLKGFFSKSINVLFNNYKTPIKLTIKGNLVYK